MSARKQHLYLVDGSGYIFRAYHRLPPLTDPEGTPVGAVYGFTAMLWKLIEELHGADEPTHLAVVLDAGRHTFRNELYPEYKAHRPDPPEDLVPQFPLIRDAVRAFSVPCIEQAGVEADDIIGCYAKAALAAGWNVTIVSSDKDLMQLVEPGLDLYDTLNNRRLGRDAVIEKFGVPPEQVVEVQALMGDAVDNVPGVRGVGPKTASELIKQFGDVENLIANIDQIARPKLREAIANSIEDIRISRKLVELKCDIDLPEPIEAFAIKDPPHGPLSTFLKKHGFRSLLAKLAREAASEGDPLPEAPEAPPFDHSAYQCITDEKTLDAWIAKARAQGFVAVDTETTSLDATRAELVGVSLALAAGKACYIPVGHGSGEGLLAERPPQLPRDLVVEKLKPLLEDPATLKIGQNLKYDMMVLARYGLNVTPFDDTMLISYALDAGKGGHGMDDLAQKHLGHSCIAYKDVCGTGKSEIGFAEVPLDKATAYAAEDADVTLRLWQALKPRLWAEQVTQVYEMIDRPMVPVVASMERAGIKVAREALVDLSAAYASEIARLETEIFALSGGPFNIGSPKQLGEILFDRLGLPAPKRGKTGAYSTDVNVLEGLANEDGGAIAALVLEWRSNSKLKSTYTDALQARINPETGRVHTSFHLAATSTGRLSSNDPNLQNIPIRTEMGRKIRHAFVAEPGHVILAADYSQIELRLMAHIADVPQLQQVYAEDGDVHWLTAQEIFPEEIAAGVSADELRRRAKTINFSIIYGTSAFGLAQRLGVDRGSAQRTIDRYFDRFPGIRAYMARAIAEAREHGYVKTLFGRKIHTPMIGSKNVGERQFAERAAVNAPMQGTAADIVKRAMIRMPAALAEAGLKDTRMLLQVHDELVFEVADDEVARAREVILRTMCHAAEPAVKLCVPLNVEIGTGPSWGAAH